MKSQSLKSVFLLILGLAVFVPGIAHGAGNKLLKVSHTEKGDTTEIVLHCLKPASFSVFRSDNPPTVTVELSDTDTALGSSMKIDSWSVSRIAFTKARSASAMWTKVNVLKARSGSYNVTSSGSKVIITVKSYQSAPPQTREAMKKLAEIRKMAESVDAELKEAKAKLLKARKQLTDEKSNLHKTISTREKANRDLVLMKDAYLRAQKKNAYITSALYTAKKRMLAVQKEEKEALVRLGAIEKKTEELNRRRMNNLSSLKNISSSIVKYQKNRSDLENSISSSRNEINALRKQIETARKSGKSVAALEVKLNKTQSELAAANARLRGVFRTIETAAKKKAQLETLTKKEEQKLAALRIKLDREKKTLNSQLSQMEKGLNDLRSRKHSLVSELNSIKARRKSITANLEREKELAEKYEKARKKSVELQIRAKKLAQVELLKAKKAEEIRKTHENLISIQKKNLEEVRRIRDREIKILEKLRASRLEHEKLLKSEQVRLRKLEKEGNTQKLREIKNKQAQRRAALIAIEKRHSELEKESRKASNELKTLKNRVNASKAALENVRNSYLQVQTELANISKLRDEARAGLFEMKASLESLGLKRKEEQKRLASLLRVIKSKRIESANVNKKLQALESRMNALSREKYLKEAEMKSLASNETLLRRKIESNRTEITGLVIRKKKLENEVSLLEEKQLNLKNSIENGKTASIAHERKLRVLIEKRKNELAALEKKARVLTAEVKNISSDKSVAAPAVYKGKVVSDINKVDFLDSPWSHQIVLYYKGRVTRPLATVKGDSVVLRIPGARFQQHLARKTNTSAYKGPVNSFITWNSGNEARVKLYTQGPRKSEIRYKKDRLIVLIPKNIAEVRAHKNSMKNASPTAVAGYYSTVGKVVNNNLPTATDRKYRRAGRSGKIVRRRYSGRTVDLDFKDAELHNVIRLVAEVWGKNVVIPDDVKGTVSIKLTNVRVDQAFDVILKSKGLNWSYEGANIIRVMTMEQQKKEREELIARTQTKVKLIQTETRLIPINYASAQDIAKAIESNVKSSRGKVTFDKRTNVIIYVDVPSKLQVAEKLVKSLDLPTPQVQIEARIVEAESTFLREIGVQWGGSLLATSATGNPTGLIFPSNVGLAGGNMDTKTISSGISSAGASNPDFAVNLPAAVGSGAGGALGMTLGSLSGAVNINLRLSAMEEIGHVRSIAAPKITTLDNTEAKISQGVEIPYPQSSAQGNTVIMKQAVLSLSVTPHVTNDNMVQLKIEVTKDEPDETHKGADGSLGIAKKAAKTEMLVKSGDTAVIGGIYKRQSTLLYKKIPWFADLPIFGWLFKNQYKKDTRSELLIFITPRVLNRSGVSGSR